MVLKFLSIRRQGTAERSLQLVIPAKARIQFYLPFAKERNWIPAFAGMTRMELCLCG
jgi:hypothetical protein